MVDQQHLLLERDMKKFFALASLSLLGASFAFAGDEKTQASKDQGVVVVVGKPSRFRVVSTPVQVVKTELVTKTSTAPATMVVEEKKGIFGRWKTVNTSIVIKESAK
jgi:hypothetical protein